MKLFTVKLSDEERDKLEAHRIRLGLRSQAETVRALISTPAGPVYTRYPGVEVPWPDGAVSKPAYRAEQEALNKHRAGAAKLMKPTLVPDLPIGNIKGPMQKKPKGVR